MTYRELWDRAVAVAARLLPAQPRRVVVVDARRHPETVVAALGVLMAGHTLVLLDPALPLPYRQNIVQRLTPPWTLRIVDGEAEVQEPELAGCRHNAPADGLAYIAVTSGSTGHPKLVRVSAQALDRFVEVMAAYYELSPTDVVVQAASGSFDVWHEEVWPTLVAGGVLEILPQPLGSMAFDSFTDVVRATGATVVNLPASYFIGWTGRVRDVPVSLRLVVTGTESVTMAAMRRFLDHTGRVVRVVNAYGITETTVTSVAWEVAADHPGATAPIGRALPGVGVVVVDDHLRPVPDGHVGELLIGGFGVAEGYLDDPVATAARFLSLRFHGQPFDRWYRSGDLVRTVGGLLEFRGRLDDQIKLQGHRIEPGEIEHRLRAAPGVADVRVLVEDGQIHAFAVAIGVTGPEILDWARSCLPERMVPSSCRMMRALPLGPSGKLNRRALLSLPAEAVDQPASELGQMVAGLWCQLLPGLAAVDEDTNFFAAGGTSLIAARMVATLRRSVSCQLELTDLFSHPDFRSFVEIVAARTPVPVS